MGSLSETLGLDLSFTEINGAENKNRAAVIHTARILNCAVLGMHSGKKRRAEHRH
jgi:hypothetical protein